MQKRLIVGLGNPGSEYVNTRHNVGFWAVEKFASQNDFEFTKKKLLMGLFAKKELDGKAVFLLLPHTYMNESGRAVVSALKNLNLTPENLLVVVDDVDLPLGSIRFRRSGSSGGHKGLTSIEGALHTQAYSRLRIGVGGRENGDLVGHVLGKFNEEERAMLENIREDVLGAIKLWLSEPCSVENKKIAGD